MQISYSYGQNLSLSQTGIAADIEPMKDGPSGNWHMS